MRKSFGSKYGNKKTVVDGITFPSKKEASYYIYLKDLKKKGEIRDFERQVVYTFASGIKYVLDFRVTEKDGRLTHKDVKGVLTPVYRLKKKLMKHEFNIDIQEV